jgi:hypothetical protein
MGFEPPSKGGFNGLFLIREYAEVMQWWSNGVMKGLIEVEFRALVFSNTPIL